MAFEGSLQRGDWCTKVQSIMPWMHRFSGGKLNNRSTVDLSPFWKLFVSDPSKLVKARLHCRRCGDRYLAAVMAFCLAVNADSRTGFLVRVN